MSIISVDCRADVITDLGGHMRAALEAAMGRVITSQAACDEFVADPRRYAAGFELDPVEIASLLAMRDDLVELMPGFVGKRSQMLGRVCRRTLNVLAPAERHAVLSGYCATRPPAEQPRADWLGFAEHLLDYSRSVRDRPHPEFVSDVANYDRVRMLALQFSRPLGPPQHPPAVGDLDPDRPLRLAPFSAVEDFGWDLRSIAWFGPLVAERTPPDPCTLISFHHPVRDGHELLRILPSVVPAVRVILADPGTPARVAIAETVQPRRALNTLSRLAAQGAIT